MSHGCYGCCTVCPAGRQCRDRWHAIMLRCEYPLVPYVSVYSAITLGVCQYKDRWVFILMCKHSLYFHPESYVVALLVSHRNLLNNRFPLRRGMTR